MKPNALSLQSSVVGRANLRTYIQAAKKAGFDLSEERFLQLERDIAYLVAYFGES